MLGVFGSLDNASERVRCQVAPVFLLTIMNLHWRCGKSFSSKKTKNSLPLTSALNLILASQESFIWPLEYLFLYVCNYFIEMIEGATQLYFRSRQGS